MNRARPSPFDALCRRHTLFRERIVDFISRSPRRVTLTDLERGLGARSLPEKRALRKAVRQLVDQGCLQYAYRLGCSFLEPSIQGVVHVTRRLVLKPAHLPYSPAPGEVVVSLVPGSAFGLGDHASTRLALRGIERAVRENPGFQGWKTSRMLDIGTGTGVLMIAAVRLGMKGAVGLDPDPCARYEARENIRINGVADRAAVKDAPVEVQHGPFALVAANLRWPTLAQLAPRIGSLTCRGAGVVLSGIREEELGTIRSCYARAAFSTAWTGKEQGWCGVLLIKGPKEDRHAPGHRAGEAPRLG